MCFKNKMKQCRKSCKQCLKHYLNTLLLHRSQHDLGGIGVPISLDLCTWIFANIVIKN